MLRIAAAVLFCLLPGASLASTTGVYPALAGVESVDVGIVHRNLGGHDWLPFGADLERKIALIAADVLPIYGIDDDPSSRLRLVLVVDHSLQRSSSSWTAIAVEAALSEPVVIKRKGCRAIKTESAITWSFGTLDVVSLDDAEETILARCRYLLEFFGGHVRKVSE